MNRINTLAGLLLMAGSITAQQHSFAPRPHMPGVAAKLMPEKNPMGSAQAKDGATVWSEDFANGLAGNNGIGPWTTSGPDGALWLQDLDGPNGDFSSTAQKIQSTTNANGFMIFDSNLSNPGGALVDRIGAMESPALDLSATPYVHLIFEQRLRWCCSAEPGHFVEISTDGGANWPTIIQVDENDVINVDSQTDVKRVNLGIVIAGDASNVKFRFQHDMSGAGSMSHYYWQVDDVRIVESPINDLVINNSTYNEWFFDTALDYEAIEYGAYPYSQLRPLNIKANITNDGSSAQPNVVLDVNVDGPGGSVFSASPSIAVMAPGTRDSLYAPGFTPPAVEGDYTVQFELSSDSVDENSGDNTVDHEFEVTEYDYGIDNGARDGRNWNGIFGYEACNVFHIINDAEITAVRVVVATGSVLGTVFNCTLRSNDGNQTLVDETEEHTLLNTELSATNQAKWITLLFSSPIQVFAGEEYYACLQSYGGQDSVLYGTSGLSERTASLYYTADDATWYYTTETPMVRITFDPTVGIEEADRQNGVGLGQNYPNPANGNTVIPYELSAASVAIFQLFDLSGKLLERRALGNKPAGVHRLEVDTRTLPEGVYYYTLQANGNQLAKRMTVIH